MKEILQDFQRSAVDLNFTQPYQTYLRGHSNDGSDKDAAAFFVMLSTALCFKDDICSDIVEMLLAAGIAITSLFVASMPTTYLRNNYQTSAIPLAKSAMSVLFVLSFLAGIDATLSSYEYKTKHMYNPDNVEKFNAAASATISGSLVTITLTGISAGVVSAMAPKRYFVSNVSKMHYARNDESNKQRKNNAEIIALQHSHLQHQNQVHCY